MNKRWIAVLGLTALLSACSTASVTSDTTAGTDETSSAMTDTSSVAAPEGEGQPEAADDGAMEQGAGAEASVGVEVQ